MDSDSKRDVYASIAPENAPSTLPTRKVRRNGQEADVAAGEGHVAGNGAAHPEAAAQEAALAEVIAPEPPAVSESAVISEPAVVAQEAAEQVAEEQVAAPAKEKTRPAWLRVPAAVFAARWVLAIPALPLALYGGWLIEQERTSPMRVASVPPLLGWQLLAAGGVLLALAAWPVKALLPAGPSNFLKNVRAQTRGQRILFWVPLGLAILCAIGAVPLFWQINSLEMQSNVLMQNWLVNTGSWLLYIASLLLFAVAFIVWERTSTPPEEGVNPSPPADRLPRWLDWAIILGLFAVALYVRVNNLENVPPGLWFDEAQNGIVGRQLASPDGVHYTFISDLTQMGALYFYFVGMLVNFVGNSILPLRLLPAVSGALLAPMLFVLGSRLYGWRVGLAAAGFLSISAWNITFSRFGMASLATVALDVAVYLCMAQALRTGRLGYYAAGGVLMGLAMQIYYVARLVPVILIVLLLHKLITERLRLVRSLRAGVVVFAVGALMAFSPVGLFALQRSQEYNGRPEIVSVFSPMNSPNQDALRRNLEYNIQRHWLMFNWVGDGNGRHNLGGTPNLDWITASLFFAGLAACVARAWRWQFFFPIVWFAAEASGGVFTLPFEAPQSHRTLENSVVTALMAGIFLGEVWAVLAGAPMVERIGRLIGFFRRRAPSREGVLKWPYRLAWAVSGAAILLALVWAGGINLNKYFEIQMKDLGVWKDMGAREAHAAIVTKRYGIDYDVYVAPVLKGLPPSQYLAPNVVTLDWPGMQILPLSSGKSSGAIIILDLPSAADVSMLARIYPKATFEIYTTPNSPEPLLYTIVIPASDIEAAHGVRAELFEPGSTQPRESERQSEMFYDWSQSDLKEGSVRLSTVLKVDQYGFYKFDWRNDQEPDSPSELAVDGFAIAPNQPITLESGLHTIVATNTVSTGAGTSMLLWAPPGSEMVPLGGANLFDPEKVQPRGLTGHVRPGPTFDGAPTTGRIDPVISFYFHITPLPRPYSIEWNGKLYIPQSGMYAIGTEQLSTSRLYIDGAEKVVNNNINNLMETQVELDAGFHDIKLQFTDLDNASHMYLYWAPPGRPRTIIPSAFLFPVMGAYPEPGSEGLATLEESDGSSLPENRIVRTTPQPGQEAPKPQPQPQAQPPQPQPQADNPQPPAPLKGEELKPLFVIGETGETLERPKAAAVDGEGNIYIFTEGDSKIHKYSADGKPLTAWDVKDPAGKPVTEGSALVVNQGKLLLLDASTSNTLRYTTGGEFEGMTQMCQCFFARGMSATNDGNLWIANTGGNQLLKVNSSGQAVRTGGEKGDQAGQFLEPASVWEAPDGTIFVADVGNSRVQSLDPDFKPLAQWHMGSSVARDGNRLTGDSQNNVLVTQFDGRAVVHYDKTGKELTRWVHRRGGEGAVPSGIAPLGDDKFIILYPEVGSAVVFALNDQ